MRVIRTEMYFDKVVGADLPPRHWPRRDEEKYNYGLTFAWFRGDEPGPFEIQNDKRFRIREIALDQVRPTLDMLLREHDRGIEFPDAHLDERVENSNIIDFVYDQTIILEQSPPVGVPFKEILKRTNAPIYVGALVGFRMTPDNPALMIITIPLGIIVVGSALGISEAMASGLNKRVKEMFERKKRG